MVRIRNLRTYVTIASLNEDAPFVLHVLARMITSPGDAVVALDA
jgi:hypothetical protein